MNTSENGWEKWENEKERVRERMRKEVGGKKKL